MKTENKPQRLIPGDKIRVVSPSEQTGRAHPERALYGAEQLSVQTGLVAVLPPESLATEMDRYAQAEEFNAAIRDKDIQALMWMIGGCSAITLLDLLDFTAFQNHPKVHCGYSDATVIHHAIYAATGCTTLYGPTLIVDFAEPGGADPFTVQSFCAMTMQGYMGELPESPYVIEEFIDWNVQGAYQRKKQKAPQKKILKAGNAAGPLLAGCLPSVLRLVGTPWLPDYREHILALEFTDDPGYSAASVIADLWQMKHTGLLKNLNGIIFGRPRLWSDMDRAFFERHIIEITSDYSYPLYTEFEFGHIQPILSLPIGIEAEMSGGRLFLRESYVSS